MPNNNSNFHKAKSAKNDEFYTQLPDIEKEMQHYSDKFRDKVIYCNCDDPRSSNFFHYFSHNFEKLGLKKLITTCYKNNNPDAFTKGNSDHAIYLEYTGDKNNNRRPDDEEIIVKELKGDGDFRSDECIEILKQADIVVTNPPFSLFREYVNQLVEYDKKFIVVGHVAAICYKNIFPLIMDGKMWLGHGFKGMATHFRTPYEDYATATDRREGMVRVSGVHWFTNLEHGKRHEFLNPVVSYHKENYPELDNYNAIEVSKVKDIPCDYYDVMAVPITFLDKWCPEEFEILGITTSWSDKKTKIYPKQIQIGKNGEKSEVTKMNDAPAIKLTLPPSNKTYYVVNNAFYKTAYTRLLIRRINHDN